MKGDAGYFSREWLFTPYNNPRRRCEVKFKEAHRSTRGIIERAFGLLKMRFHCLDHSGGVMQYAPEKVAKIILVCCILHNIAIRRGIEIDDEEEISFENFPEVICNDAPTRQAINAKNYVAENYFKD
ncbi:putative nuclease HARBI1 [Bombina bombina]|uniref:putative nuclease HARBI1 n=1 Tax=Bombina bombina TaxID=8345 RepID=UPI00235A5F00|nr:putative nuclease HARBI1 [Bombina bombina]